ncbi:MAG: FtsP/CotA-like multicopper oxidase with cupredoxin domain, partial [Planctomycetota bacterium]
MKFYKAVIVGVISALTASTAVAGADFDPTFDPASAVDINADPNIVEVNLVAAPIMWQFIPGVNTAAFAYNGQIPGPLLEVDLGQTLRVNFTNNLGEDTTIHWHGVDAPADMDGSHISQLVIPDGGTFTYEFEMLTPGLKWYHPHVRTDVMVEHGLYGPILVRDVVAETALNLQGQEHIVMFDDIRIDEVTGIIDTFDYTDPLERVIYQTSGRTGNVLLVNGKRASDVELNVANGEPQRWYNWNVSNSVFARLDLNEFYEYTPAEIGNTPYQIPGEQWPGEVWKVGGDRGLLASVEQRSRVVEVLPTVDHFIFQDFRAILLVPGERMDVIFTPFGREDENLPVDQWDWARGDHVAFYKPDGTIGLGDDPEDGFKDTVKYFDMKLIGPDPGGPYYAPPTILDPGNIVELDIIDVDKTVNVTFGHSTPDAAGNVNFFAVVDGGTPMPFPKLTSLVAADLEIGDVVQWNVKNLSHGDHPFHTHGFAFQWYETEYFDAVTPAFNYFEFPTQITNKDTILVPARTGAKGTSNTTLRALMLIDDTGREGRLTAQGRWPTANTSGGYLFHCHILEHVTRGMMGFFEVFDPTDPFANLGGAT